MSKRTIRLTENELRDLIVKGLIGTDPSKYLDTLFTSALKTKDPQQIKSMVPSNISQQMYDDFMSRLGVDKTEADRIKKDIIKNKETDSAPKKYKKQFTSGSYELDMNNRDEYRAYETICDKFISTRSHNLLGITGGMLADGAKMAYNRFGVYVPPELALSQLVQEGGFSGNKNARPIKTRNPFNVGNVDSGSNIFHSSVQSGINKYYELIAKRYLGGGKNAEDLYRNFVNKAGNRYAKDPNYESKIRGIAGSVKNISEPIYASLESKNQNVV